MEEQYKLMKKYHKWKANLPWNKKEKVDEDEDVVKDTKTAKTSKKTKKKKTDDDFWHTTQILLYK